MISLDLYKATLTAHFKNKALIKDFEKIYQNNENNYEVASFYIERKQIGLLFLLRDDDYYVTKITKSSMTADKTGRLKPVICDLCYTRMPGSKIAMVSTVRKTDSHSFTWMMCNNLNCSLHAREQTDESKESIKILGENIPIERRVERLDRHIKNIVDTLHLRQLKEELHA